MKIKIYLIFLILYLFVSPNIFSQNIDFERLSFGATVQYLKTDGDFNKYWGNQLAAGILVNYKIDDSFSLEGGLLGAFVKPENEPEKFPDFLFLNFPAGIKYSLPVSEIMNLNFFAGIQNNSFLFSGDAAEIVEENNLEHELGLFFQAGMEVLTFNNFGIEINSKIQNIFTLPEQLKIINFGLTVYYY